MEVGTGGGRENRAPCSEVALFKGASSGLGVSEIFRKQKKRSGASRWNANANSALACITSETAKATGKAERKNCHAQAKIATPNITAALMQERLGFRVGSDFG